MGAMAESDAPPEELEAYGEFYRPSPVPVRLALDAFKIDWYVSAVIIAATEKAIRTGKGRAERDLSALRMNIIRGEPIDPRFTVRVRHGFGRDHDRTRVAVWYA